MVFILLAAAIAAPSSAPIESVQSSEFAAVLADARKNGPATVNETTFLKLAAAAIEVCKGDDEAAQARWEQRMHLTEEERNEFGTMCLIHAIGEKRGIIAARHAP